MLKKIEKFTFILYEDDIRTAVAEWLENNQSGEFDADEVCLKKAKHGELTAIYVQEEVDDTEF